MALEQQHRDSLGRPLLPLAYAACSLESSEGGAESAPTCSAQAVVVAWPSWSSNTEPPSSASPPSLLRLVAEGQQGRRGRGAGARRGVAGAGMSVGLPRPSINFEGGRTTSRL